MDSKTSSSLTPARRARADDDDNDNSKKIKTKKPCPYGSSCYRKNPAHREEFSHETTSPALSPSDPPASPPSALSTPSSTPTIPIPIPSPSTSTLPSSPSPKVLPPCPFGLSCYRKNLLHFAEFSHPTKGASVDSNNNNNSDSDSDDDDDQKDKDDNKNDNNDDSDKTKDSKPGPGMLKRSYSSLTEDERKQLIEEAFNAKSKLAEMEKKNESLKAEVEAMRSAKIALLPGEKKARDGDKLVTFPLISKRNHASDDPAEVHYRYAESQFLRLGATGVYVTQVDYIINPPLVKQFEARQEELSKKYGKPEYPLLAFHGTKDANIDHIIQTNFKLSKLAANTGNKGFYGAGVYFSEYTSTALCYGAGASRLLLSKVLVGRQFHCKGLMMGAPLQKGYDTHVSPCGTELVIYHEESILPCYVIHYTKGVAKVNVSPAKTVLSTLITADGSSDSVKCSCRGDCSTRRCACVAAGESCGTRCHKARGAGACCNS